VKLKTKGRNIMERQFTPQSLAGRTDGYEYSHANTMQQPVGYRSESAFSSSPTKSVAAERFSAEQHFHERLKTLNQVYENRIRSLGEEVRRAYVNLQGDDILNTMKDDPSSSEFAEQRIREIIEDSLSSEQERFIQNLANENAQLRSELTQVQSENHQQSEEQGNAIENFKKLLQETEERAQEHAKKSQYFEEECTQLKGHLSNMTETFQEALQRKESEIEKRSQEEYADLNASRLENKQLHDRWEVTERQLWEKTQEIDRLRAELETSKQNGSRLDEELAKANKQAVDMKEAIEDYSRQIDELTSVNRDLDTKLQSLEDESRGLNDVLNQTQREKIDLEEKYNSYGNQFKQVIQAEQASNLETIESLQAKFKSKSKQFKKKIQDQKEMIDSMDAEIEGHKNKFQEARELYEKSIDSIQEDMKKVRDEWDRKCKDQELEHERYVAELQSKHQLQMSALQNQYQQQLEDKINQIKNETTSEISKSKMHDSELKLMIEEKIAALERDYIKINRHEEILNEQLNNMKHRQSLETREISEKYEIDMRRSLKQLEEKKENEMDEVVGKLRSDVKHYESTLEDAREYHNELEEKLRKEKDVNAKLSVEVGEIENSKRLLVQHLDEASQNIGRLKSICEEEVKKRKTLEEELSAFEQRSNELAADIQEKETQIDGLKKDMHILTETIDSKDDDLARQEQKQRGLLKEIEEQNSAIDSLEKEKTELSRQLNETAANLSRETQSFHNQSVEIRHKESQKLEREVSEHMETRNRLMQAEGKINYLNAELTDLQKRASDQKTATGNCESEIRELKSTIYQKDTQYTILENDNTELKRRIERLKRRVIDERAKAVQILGHKLTTLRAEVKTIKANASIDIERARKDASGLLQELLIKHQDVLVNVERGFNLQVREMREEWSQEWEDKLRHNETVYKSEAHDITSRYEDEINSKGSKLDEMTQEYSKLRRDYEDTLDKVAEGDKSRRILEQEKSELQNRIVQLSQEINKLQIENERLKGEWKRDVAKARGDSDHLLEMVRKELTTRHKSQLGTINSYVDELKAQSAEDLAKMEKEIATLEANHREEMSNLLSVCENDVRKLEVTVTDEADRNEDLRSQLRKLEEERKRLQESYLHQIANLEKKQEELNDATRGDQEKYLQYKMEKNAEIENLSRQLRELSRELALKNDVVDELTKEKDILRQRFRESQLQVEVKNSHMDMQQREIHKTRNVKDKEIEELQSLLIKSYRSVHGNMDNIKMASKLDAETQALTRQVRSSMRESSLPRQSVAERLDQSFDSVKKGSPTKSAVIGKSLGELRASLEKL